MKAITAALFGLIFGFGLVISGMTDPNRILAFLDIAGDWDPSLALVMAAAIAVTLPAYALARRRGRTAFGEAIDLPDRKRPITRSLVIGAAIFGVGWGLSGLCPGPSIVLLSTGALKAFLFFGAIVAGLLAVAAIQGATATASQGSDGSSRKPATERTNRA